MTKRFLRGTPAPMGFSHSVGGWLRAYVFRERQPGGLSMTAQARLNLIDACSALPVAVGDDDPRIRTLALASPGGQWQPGQEQLAVIHGAGHQMPGEDNTLRPDEFLNALMHAATLDLAMEHRRELEQVKKGTEAAPTHEAMLRFEKDRADTESAARAELQRENGNLREQVIRERQRRREAEAIAMGAEPVPVTATVAGPRELPKNVRKHGSGYQGYVKVNGKTTSQTFPTPEAAAGWVAEQQNQAAREKTVSEAQHPREFNPSPEELAAMQERAAA